MFQQIAMKYLPELEKRLSTCITCESDHVNAIISHVLSTRGKRIRPLLAIASAMCVCDHAQDAVLDVACAVELVHTASLVHDDLIDESGERRGVITINAQWGNHVAVLAGDVLLSRALSMLTPYPGAVDAVSLAIARMCESEIDQAESAFDTTQTEQAYLRRISGKTAALLQASCQTGALVAGAPPDIAAGLGQYGLNLGLAFQIADDILDFVGDAADMGKPTCSDLRAGIVTLPVIYLLRDAARSSYLREALAGRRLGRKMKRVVKDLVSTGALEEAASKALRFLDKAREYLEEVPECSGRNALLSALNLVADRMSMKASECQILASLGAPRPAPQTQVVPVSDTSPVT